MANVNCTVYFREHGTSKIYAVDQAKGRVSRYGIRWYEGTRQRQKIIGHYPAAVAANLFARLFVSQGVVRVTLWVVADFAYRRSAKQPAILPAEL